MNIVSFLMLDAIAMYDGRSMVIALKMAVEAVQSLLQNDGQTAHETFE